MNRVARPYRTHQRFHHRLRVHDQRPGRHLDDRHLGHQNLKHPLEHRHRSLGVDHRNQHLLDEDHRHLLDDPERHPDDFLGHLPGDLDRRLGDRLPGDPFPVMGRTGCCLGAKSGEEFPCPVPKRKDYCPDEECQG